MDRRTLHHYLAQTDDHIDQVTERLERQSRIIEQLKRTGRATAAAEELTSLFEQTLEGIRAERQRILDLLGALRVERRRVEAQPRPDGALVVHG